MSDLAFTCPECGRTSSHPEDVANSYCGACKTFWHTLDCPGCGNQMWVSEDDEARARLGAERRAFSDYPDAEFVAVCNECWEGMRRAFPTLDARLKLEGL